MASPSDSNQQQQRFFTWADIARISAEKTNDQLLTVIHNKVYDIGGDFATAFHPGGRVALSQVGFDATGAFEEFHQASAHEVMANFYVGDLEPSEIKKESESEFRRDIDKLKSEFETKGYFTSSKIYYMFKIASNLSILASSVALLHFFHNSTLGVLSSALVLALFWQQCGWLAHDFLHHQVYENRSINNAIGFFVGNVCQGFSVNWWKNKHFVHHAVPNIHNADPDIDTMPYLAWSEHALELFNDLDDKTIAKFLVSHQPFLYFPLLSFARLSWALSSIFFNVSSKEHEMTAAHRAHLTLERVTLFMHWAWYLSLAFYYNTPLMALLYIFVSQAGCGIMLAVVFSVNHNGMPVFDSDRAQNMDFYELQILTGRDVEPSIFNDFFTGGLNYQIEHHLWPTLPRHNFHKVRKAVVDLCAKHKIAYHSTTLQRGVQEVVDRLVSISKSAQKPSYMKR